VVVNYESNQIKLFESQSGSITEALTVLSYKDYANRLRSYIDANNFSADAKAEIMDQVNDRLLYARKESSEIVGDKRGAIRILINGRGESIVHKHKRNDSGRRKREVRCVIHKNY
jgi:hypothetical protein